MADLGQAHRRAKTTMPMSRANAKKIEEGEVTIPPALKREEESKLDLHAFPNLSNQKSKQGSASKDDNDSLKDACEANETPQKVQATPEEIVKVKLLKVLPPKFKKSSQLVATSPRGVSGGETGTAEDQEAKENNAVTDVKSPTR